MYVMMNDTSIIQLSKTQALIHAINANVTYAVWARNSGKSSGGIGLRVLHLSEVMPGAQVILYSDTFERLNDVIVPGVIGFLQNEAGIVEGEDFVKFKKPPDHWSKPITPLDKFDKVISFRSGFCLCLASQKVSGSANGFNAYALIVDETKFIKEEKINTEVLPAIRGNIAGRKMFGHLPEYCSKWYFTDKWGNEIKWILKKKKLMNKKNVDAVLTIQKEVLRQQALMNECTTFALKYKHKQKIDFLQKAADKLRRTLVYYSDAKPYDNMMIAGPKFFRDQKRDLSAMEFGVAIENNDPDTVPNVFYPTFSKVQHCHQIDDVVNPLKPFLVAMDYQWRITPMVVAQVGDLPDRGYKTLNIVAGVHTMHPGGGIRKTVQAFCEKYATHINKEVHYFFDHTAVAERSDADSFYETAKDEFRKQGWAPIECYLGKASLHNDRYKAFIGFFNNVEDMAITVHEFECEFLIKSVQQAGAYTLNKQTKKDKSKEKNLNYAAEEQTDYSEAMDQLLWGVLQMKMYNDGNVIGAGIYTGA
jgi:hypothetical protein